MAQRYLSSRLLAALWLQLGTVSCATASMTGAVSASATPVIDVRPDSATYTATVVDSAMAITVRVTVQNRSDRQIEVVSCGANTPWFTLERLTEEGWVKGYEAVCAGASNIRIRVTPHSSLSLLLPILHSWISRAIPFFTGGRVDATYRVRLGLSWVPSSPLTSVTFVSDSVVISHPFAIRLQP